jgi:filamin
VIKFGGKEVAKSPYHVNVTPAADCVKIFGPGLEAGLKTGKPTTFTIDAKAAGEGKIECTIEGPNRNNIDFEMKDNGDGTHTVTYRPTKPGQYTISVKFDKVLVPKCPVKVAVGTSANASTKIKAWGPGLERGVAGRPVLFYVSVKNAPIENLGVQVDGPAPAKVEMEPKDDEEDTMIVRYFPTTPGKYLVHIRYEETDIKESPYTAVITPRGDLNKVHAKGPGLEEGNMAGKPCEFTVFTKDAGVKNPAVTVTCVNDDTKEPVDVRVKNNGDGTFKCAYFPKIAGPHTITIEFMDEPIPKSPVKVTIKPFCDPANVKCYGPGLSGGKCGKPAQFNIDATKAGEGGIDVTIEGPTETEIKYDDHGDGTCGVEYLPVEEGDYKINVLFDQHHVPGSPFTALISDEFDAGKVVIDGPGLKPGKTGTPCIINIDSTKAGKAKLGVEVFDEVGEPVKVTEKETEPGVFDVSYTPEKPGAHTINVTYGGKAVPKSPFKVKVKPAADASKVKCTGPGLDSEKVTVEEETFIEIDITEAGEGKLDVQVEPTK